MAISIDRILDAAAAAADAAGKLPEDEDAKAEAIADLKASLRDFVVKPIIDEILANGEISVTVNVTTTGALDSENVDFLPLDGIEDAIVMDTATSGSGTGTGTGTIS